MRVTVSGRPRWKRSDAHRPLIIAHRGASAQAPENSVGAFARAVADGADGVELDVLLAASGEVVVFHDDDLMRLAGRPERVVDLPWSVLRQVRLRGDVGIPILEEALEAARPLLVNIEIKTDGLWDPGAGELVDRVAAIVERTQTGPRVLISSFSPWALWQWRRRRPDLPSGWLFGCGEARLLRGGRAVGAILRPSAVHPEAVLCTPEAVAGWHARGYAVNCWTIDDPTRLQELRAMGVDGLITNDPAAARAALEVAAGPAAARQL